MRPDLLFDNFNLVTDAPDGIPKIREMILQLAVQGKLVPQDPDEEPASELLKRISSEKERLIKEGKIKKQKPLPPIKPDEVPYELPEGWEWVRLGEIQTFINGYAFKSADYQNEGVGIVRIGDISNGQISKHNMKYVSPGLTDSLDPNLFIKKDDLLIAMSGATTGKLGFNRTDDIFVLNQRVGKFNTILISNEFLYFYLNTRIKENLRISAGSAIQNLSTKQINNTFTPLPPIKEQNQIVKKVNQLEALCDQMEAEKEKSLKHRVTLNATAIDHLLEAKSANEFDKHWHLIANNFDLLYDNPENVQKLRQAILHLAVSGKLVPQNPSDEPASELLNRIKAEKDRLVKEGKIKKQKPLPPIDSNEVPYELPEGWEWARIRNVTHELGQKKPDTIFTYIDVNSIDNNKGCISNDPKILVPEDAPSRARKIIKNGTVIYSTVRPYLLNIAVMEQNFAPEPIASTAFFVMHPFNGISNQYIFYYLRSLTFIRYVEDTMSGVAYPAINDEKMSKGLIPIPPIEEQKRIVEKVNQLMTLCDQMEACLENSSAQADTLFTTLIEQLTASSANSAYVN